MVRKASANTAARRSRVTFELPADVGAEQVQLCGDFNGWSTTATPLAPRKGGRFSVTVSLPAGRSYRYRFLLDGDRWENDWAADAYVRNEFGGDDSVVQV
jgi:1,4-alpha-glucan branching enzyme